MKNAVIKGNAKHQPPRIGMIQSVNAETLIKRAAGYFRLGEPDPTRKRAQHRLDRALVLHRYRGLRQWMIGERFGGLDEGLVSRDRSAIREKIEKDPKVVSGSREYVIQDLDPGLGRECTGILPQSLFSNGVKCNGQPGRPCAGTIGRYRS